jgi:hypothetical protein
MDNQDQHIEVRIKNIFDSNPEEEYIRSVLEPDGWEVVKTQDDPGGQRHLVLRRPICRATKTPADSAPDRT